ncbi:hypothetical protein DVH24_040407 [Malus domestica]|uniref:Uncharacterized protein n=1 Tax=Malus domestica TaxID=3750 RepID=A0A498I7P0_MALDO|nr:hypothetical protein DVH24_040407 [Malus domestica]
MKLTFHITQLLSTCRLENPPHMRGRVESCSTSVRDKSMLSSCEAKRPHALHVTQLSTWRLENPPHVRERVESCPTSVRDKVCYVLI